MSRKVLREDALRLCNRVVNLEAQLADLRAALVEFTKPPYPDSQPTSMLEWYRARASKLLCDMDKTSDTLNRLYLYKGDV